jgi:hypothetical protein
MHTSGSRVFPLSSKLESNVAKMLLMSINASEGIEFSFFSFFWAFFGGRGNRPDKAVSLPKFKGTAHFRNFNSFARLSFVPIRTRDQTPLKAIPNPGMNHSSVIAKRSFFPTKYCRKLKPRSQLFDGFWMDFSQYCEFDI